MDGGNKRTLQLQTEKGPETTIVRCKGSVVIDTWAELSTALRHLIEEGKPIRVDLSNVDMVDSVGIGSFVSVWASAKKAGCDLKFRNPNKRVQDVVELTRLYDLFEAQTAAKP
jgi:anti-sigma B factor antagonist